MMPLEMSLRNVIGWAAEKILGGPSALLRAFLAPQHLLRQVKVRRRSLRRSQSLRAWYLKANVPGVLVALLALLSLIERCSHH